MLAVNKRSAWHELTTNASPAELAWMNGYLEGLLAGIQQAGPEPAPTATIKAPSKFTILYGTETGNTKSLSTKLAATARKAGHIVKLAALDQYRLADLKQETRLIVVISTQGDGEPPAQAKAFYDHVHDATTRLPDLRYAVLGLGDSAYPLFCQTGIDIDRQLERAGGKRIAPLQQCDTDYETAATSWFATTLQQLGGEPSQIALPLQRKAGQRKEIHNGIVRTHINLNDTGSSKETYHIELEAADIPYEPGDALGIVPSNSEALVTEIMGLLGLQPDARLTFKDQDSSVSELLQRKLNITYLPGRVVRQYAALSQQEIPEIKIGLAHLLQIYPLPEAVQPEAVIGLLEPIAPRLYSISSAPAAHEGTIHLTVSKDRFSINGQEQQGLCSGYLSQLQEGAALAFYVHPNKAFRLPEEDRDVIMIGPGTGIAPFRSFLAQREASGSSGRNWLFFGDQHFNTDFLYQSEIQSWHETGLLTRVNVAFSRDQEQKIYVQDRMREQAVALYQWLEEGASLYICGAKEPMSIDVEKALLQIIAEQGKHTEATAEAYLEQLKATSRYHKDVY